VKDIDGGREQQDEKGQRPAWVDEQAEDAYSRPARRRDRPGHVPLPGKHADDGLWLHVLETSFAAAVLTWIVAIAVPHSVPTWMLSVLAGVMTAVIWYTSYQLTNSAPMAGYLGIWGMCLTGWLTAARLAGPWNGTVIFALLLPVVMLAPAGVTVIRRFRDRVKRVAETGRDSTNTRECRYWEALLGRLNVPRVICRDILRVDGGYQVHCRHGKAVDGHAVLTHDAIRDLAMRLAVHKRLPKGAVYIEEEPAGGSAADFIIHVRELRGPRVARWLPAGNGLLSVNRPFGIGVLDTGREFALKLREVVVFICGVRGSGKALALDTKIATPSGWTTMGEITAGDQVFDEAGQPCRVLATTAVLHGRRCYEIEFSGGQRITADAAHQWQVWSPQEQHPAGCPRVLTTEQLVLTAVPYSIRTAAPFRSRDGDYQCISAIRLVPSVPVRCIEVDSPSSLYLAGQACVPTHNSTLLNIFIAQLCRMPDALIFMIDLKGGQEARAWLMPWLQGHVDRPPIDWLATNREEAKIMLDALWAGGTARAESGKYARKLRPGIQHDGQMAPAVIVICDETAVMTGHFIREDSISNTQLATRLLQIAETFRSVAIDPVVAAVRAVVDVTGNSGLKAMAEVRIGMKVATIGEGQAIFPDDYPAARQLAQLKDKGSGIPKVGSELYPPVHFYNITDGSPDDDGHPTEDRITPVVLSTAERRPAPEKLLADAMGDAYAKRWEQPHIAGLLAQWKTEAGIADRPAPVLAGGGAADRNPADGPAGEDFDSIWQNDPLLSGMAGLDGGLLDDDEPGHKLNPVRKRMYTLLIEAGGRGYTAGMLWTRLENEHLSVTRQTVHSWLSQARQQGYVYTTGKPQSGKARWIWQLPEGQEFDIPGFS
jgi:hypothetical protein